jgi:hypothetical protein
MILRKGEWVVARHVHREVAGAAHLDHAVDVLLGEQLDARLERLPERCRFEPAVRQVAIGAVLLADVLPPDPALTDEETP